MTTPTPKQNDFTEDTVEFLAFRKKVQAGEVMTPKQRLIEAVKEIKNKANYHLLNKYPIDDDEAAFHEGICKNSDECLKLIEEILPNE